MFNLEDMTTHFKHKEYFLRVLIVLSIFMIKKIHNTKGIKYKKIQLKQRFLKVCILLLVRGLLTL